MSNEEFHKKISSFYDENKRDTLPWRQPNLTNNFSIYAILVSEIMLQQTQVNRVIPRYLEFMQTFPTIESLAEATFQSVLSVWSGLGYNRRAKYLHDFAISCREKNAVLETIADLTSHKGIGINTAAAVLVYSKNTRHLFVETNIRTVYIDYFFNESENIKDTDIIVKINETIPTCTSSYFMNPDTKIISYRDFYWALMDYGTYLKKSGIINNTKSSSYVKQSKFEGSSRQIRGVVLKLLVGVQAMTKKQLAEEITDDRLEIVVNQLLNEGMITQKGDLLRII